MKIFDSHIHFFPDPLAGKALARLSATCGCPYYTDGTRGDTLKKMAASGVAAAMVLHVATNARQQNSVNSFASASRGDGLFCFGSVFPGSEDAVESIHRIKAAGLHGVKLHPDYQDFYVNEEKALPVYKACEELSLPIAFHTGRDPVSPDVVHCTPKLLAEIAVRFPKLRIIAAHMGGMDMPGDALNFLADKPNVYFDTAFATYFLDRGNYYELIKKKGANKVFFATDTPWSTVETELEMLSSLPISERELELICHENARDFFEIDF